jgi:hypothetical protein
MTCPTANMESCDKKCKCVGGPCAGTAYDCADPCDPGSEFNAATCECSPGWTSVRYRIQGTQTLIRYCCNSSPTEGCTACDGSIVPGYPQEDGGNYSEENILLTRAEWDARYSTGVNTSSPCNTYETFATLASTKTWRGPGRRWTSNDGLTSGCDPSAPADAWACVGRCDGNLSASYIDGVENNEYSYG